MGWVVGLICLIIAIIFWRFILPVAVIVAAILFGFHEHQMQKQEKKEQQRAWEAEQQAKERAEKVETIKQKVAIAQQNATADGKEWEIQTRIDPASGKKVVSSVSIQSNDGLCYLRPEKQLNGDELTDISCPGIGFYVGSLEIKFDTHGVSTTVNFNGYIVDKKYKHNEELSYKQFINGLKTANHVAIKVPAAHQFWTRFSLKNSAMFIGYLGGPPPWEGNDKDGKFDLSTAKPVEN